MVFFNVYIRFALESYLDTTLVALIRLEHLKFGNYSDDFNSVLAVVLLFSTASVLVASALMLQSRRGRGYLKNKSFMARFGQLTAGLKLASRASLLFPVLFMARRLAYAVVIIHGRNKSVL